MHGDGRIDEVATQRAQARERAVFVGAGQTAESDDVGGEDRGELSSFGHRAPFSLGEIAQRPDQKRSFPLTDGDFVPSLEEPFRLDSRPFAPSGKDRYFRKDVVSALYLNGSQFNLAVGATGSRILRNRVRAPPLRRLPAASLRQSRLVQDGPQVAGATISAMISSALWTRLRP